MRSAASRIGWMLGLGAMLTLAALPAGAVGDPEKTVGPNACAECHKLSAKLWQGTHHFATFRNMPESKEARDIAGKMGIRRLKAESLCLDCHFTTQAEGSGVQAVAGISCESCHGSGKEWIKVHSEFSGKKKETESPDEVKARWAKAESAGMMRPSNVVGWAKNCYGCHVVPQEKLVNVGGHPAGSAFELVSWSQGEVRHNVWYSGGKENEQASANEKRLMYVVGMAVEIETGLRAVGKATEKADYAVAMARRVQAARTKMAEIAKALSVPEVKAIVDAANSAGLKLNNDAELSAAADKVAAALEALAGKYDGSTFAGVDALIPTAYKGTPAQ